MVCVHQIVDFSGRNSKNHNKAYVGIQPSRVMVKNFNHQNRGIDAGAVLGPIAFKTRLGQARYYLFGPFCYLNKGCNPKIAKVKGVVSRVCAKTVELHFFFLYD
jgi:hypothetical protein